TGIRVGVAAAHGIALASGARLIGVTSFAAVAAIVPDTSENALLIALDSRRAEFYVQLLTADRITPLAAPQAGLGDGLRDDVAPCAGRRLTVAGDAAEAAAAALGGEANCTVIADTAPDARGVASAALCEFGGARAPVRPFYLRPPDVTLPPRQPRGT